MSFFPFIPVAAAAAAAAAASEDSSRFLNLLANNFSSELCKGVFCVVHGSSRLAASW